MMNAMTIYPAKWTKTRFKDYLGYVYIFLYITNIQPFEIFSISVIITATLFTLIVMNDEIIPALRFFRGNAKIIIILLGMISLFMTITSYIESGSLRSGALFFLSFICILVIIGRTLLNSRVIKYQQIIIVYFMVLAISMIWFILAYYFDSFYDIQLVLYQFSDEEIMRGWRTGLSEKAHVFGYQMTTLTIGLLVATVLSKGKRRLLYLVLLGCACVTIFLLGERSVFFAIASGVSILALRRRFVGKVVKIYILVTIIFTGVYLEGSLLKRYETNLQSNIYSRVFKNEDSKDSVSARLNLQLIGVRMFLNNLGGISQGSFGDLAIESNRRAFDYWDGYYIGVHNGYLAYILRYGIYLLIMVVPVLWILFKICYKFIKYRHPNVNIDKLRIITSASLFGVMMQAMFHHASFVTHDPTTIIIILLVIGEYSGKARKHRGNHNLIIINQQ